MQNKIKQRAIVYIDGFNLYNGIRQFGQKYKWLDIESLSQSFVEEGVALEKTKFFTAKLNGNNKAVNNQKTYLSALTKHCKNTNIIYGYFSKARKCKFCNHKNFVEKQTDVNIACEMIKDAYLDNFDIAYLVSGDSDLLYPIEEIKRLGKHIIIASPTHRKSKKLNEIAHGSFEITGNYLEDNQLPNYIKTVRGFITKPLKWQKIAVLMGGNSAEREVSLNSGNAVYEALQNQGVDCFKFDWHGDNLDELWVQKFDKAFIVLHGRGGEDGYIQQQLENRGIAYTGSDAIVSEHCMNKATTKNIWQQHNLPLSPSVLAEVGCQIPNIDFPLPWAVKPILEGSSVGISKVENASDLDKALKLAWQYDEVALIEQWIEGGEYTVSILNGKTLPVIQIKINQGFYDYESKYLSDDTQYLCPCGLLDADEKQVQKIAMRAFTVLGAKTWGRVDFILDKDNMPYLLEINTVPGMTSHSLVPMAAKANGLDFNKLVLAILND
ncbi:MAG: D-alanine--D-alanine ligase [Catillopecten margaritatus gill symbiont]|uniref:D-alanine--D-alanine ligase n=1 Tax=Catillopecten margaritatus gill symbiont TaxID=3083288 RepID=A0AAU6PFB8_9GAMM